MSKVLYKCWVRRRSSMGFSSFKLEHRDELINSISMCLDDMLRRIRIPSSTGRADGWSNIYDKPVNILDLIRSRLGSTRPYTQNIQH